MTVGGLVDTVFRFNRLCECHLYTAPRNKSAPFFEAMTTGGNTVNFIARLYRFGGVWRVVDHTKPQILSIEAAKIVSFPPEATDILERINCLNVDCIGKFTLESQENLNYCLELPYTPDSTAAAFQHALFLALDTWRPSTEAGARRQRSLAVALTGLSRGCSTG